MRHTGDLGNVIADVNEEVNDEFLDREAMLFGENTIIGRAIVIHAGEDDLGNIGQH